MIPWWVPGFPEKICSNYILSIYLLYAKFTSLTTAIPCHYTFSIGIHKHAHSLTQIYRATVLHFHSVCVLFFKINLTILPISFSSSLYLFVHFHAFVWLLPFFGLFAVLWNTYKFHVHVCTFHRCSPTTTIGYAFHADTATFYKILTDEFSERSICELSEIQLFPEQHMMAIVQKGSPLRKMITYG